MEINYDVPPPFAIQVEPTEGCSLACSFCGISSIRENGANADAGIHGKNSAPYRFMTMATATRIANSIANEPSWNPRIEFAMHGEPSMHPELAIMVRIFRTALPKAHLMVTSNGSGLLKDSYERIKELFDAGLNTLALDDYKHSGGWVDRIRENIAKQNTAILGAPWETYQYPQERLGNPHGRHTGKKLVYIHDISENTTGNHQLTNQGGNSFHAEHIEARCAKPFRELSVRWDGTVAICCDDWRGEYKIGNVNAVSLHQIWYSQAFEAARRKLYLGERDFGACAGCNARSKRVGLLPDKLGKSTMAAPDAEGDKIIKKALSGRVLTIKLAKGD